MSSLENISSPDNVTETDQQPYTQEDTEVLSPEFSDSQFNPIDFGLDAQESMEYPMLSPELEDEFREKTLSDFSEKYLLSSKTSPEEIDEIVAQLVDDYDARANGVSDDLAVKEFQREARQIRQNDSGQHATALDFFRKVAGEPVGEDERSNAINTPDSREGFWGDVVATIAEKMENTRARKVLVQSILAATLAYPSFSEARGGFEDVGNQMMQQALGGFGRATERHVRRMVERPIDASQQQRRVEMQYERAVQAENMRYQNEVAQIQARASRLSPQADARYEQRRMQFEVSPGAHAEKIGWNYVDPDVRQMKEQEWAEQLADVMNRRNPDEIMNFKADVARQKEALIARYYQAEGIAEGSDRVAQYNRQQILEGSPQVAIERALESAEQRHQMALERIAQRGQLSMQNNQYRQENQDMSMQRQDASELGRVLGGGANGLIRSFGNRHR